MPAVKIKPAFLNASEFAMPSASFWGLYKDAEALPFS